MSFTILFKVPESGEIEEYVRYQNAFQGAFNIWEEMTGHYLGLPTVPMFGNMQPVWDLAESERVPLNDRIVMLSTFDNVMVRRENLPTLIAAFRDFATRFDPGHLLAQAAALEKLVDDPTCYAVCWNQTSVNGDMWLEPSGEVDEYDYPIYRLYDISKDTGHWFLFDEISLPEKAV